MRSIGQLIEELEQENAALKKKISKLTTSKSLPKTEGRTDNFVNHMRNEHRVKFLYDYSYVLKYGELIIVAPKVWLGVLREHKELLPSDLNIKWFALNNTDNANCQDCKNYTDRQMA